MNRKKQHTDNILTKLRIIASLHMSTRTEQLHKWMADGASQVSHYWSGKFKINKQDGYSDLCSNNLKLQTSIKAHAIFNIGITAMPMDRCMTLINTNIFLCSVSLGHNLESKSWFLNSFSRSQRTRASYWQTLGLRVEIRKTNTEYSVMPERRIVFLFFLQ